MLLETLVDSAAWSAPGCRCSPCAALQQPGSGARARGRGGRHLLHRVKVIGVHYLLPEPRIEEDRLSRRLAALKGALHLALRRGVKQLPRPVLPARPPPRPVSGRVRRRAAEKKQTRRWSAARRRGGRGLRWLYLAYVWVALTRSTTLHTESKKNTRNLLLPLLVLAAAALPTVCRAHPGLSGHLPAACKRDVRRGSLRLC